MHTLHITLMMTKGPFVVELERAIAKLIFRDLRETFVHFCGTCTGEAYIQMAPRPTGLGFEQPPPYQSKNEKTKESFSGEFTTHDENTYT